MSFPTRRAISADDLGGRAVRQGAIELARKKGLQVVLAEAYPQGTTDFAAILINSRRRRLRHC